MLNVASFSSPGLSVVTADDVPTTAELGSSRYRRWVERAAHRIAARQRRAEQSARQVPAPAPVRRRWIRLPSAESGTLHRLP